jgi:hypothetical protein
MQRLYKDNHAPCIWRFLLSYLIDAFCESINQDMAEKVIALTELLKRPLYE